MADGGKVSTPEVWTSRRRPELLEIFARDVYGRTPVTRLPLRATVDSTVNDALGGTAVRRQVTLRFAEGNDSPSMRLLLYLPAKATRPVPVFLALNFQGNQAVNADPGISLATTWLPDGNPGVVSHHATDASRGTEAGRFPVAQILAKGYGLATAYYGDLDPDYDNSTTASTRCSTPPARSGRRPINGAPSAPGPGDSAARSIISRRTDR